MSDMSSRRMAYRNAARAATYQYENTQLKNEAEKPEQLKVYHAHGYAIHSDDLATGDEIWRRDSAFSEVFFDFEKAKNYLAEQFEKVLAGIYRQDKMFESDPVEERDIGKASPEWRKEYIEEYIDYLLIISELTAEYGANHAEADFDRPQKIDWYLRHNGEVRTRYYVFGDREYERRESDLLPEAGTKFKVGDLVVYNDLEFVRDYPGVYIVFAPPQKPNDKRTPWVNEYELIGIESMSAKRSCGLVERATIHEADLTLCEQIPEHYRFREQLLTLQKVVTGEIQISEKLKSEIIDGRVLFNDMPSWRDFSELFGRSKP